MSSERFQSRVQDKSGFVFKRAGFEVSTTLLILGKRSIKGWSAGTPTDSEDTLRFAEAAGIRPMIEKYPLEKAAEAYVRMMSGEAQYRVVLTME